ncbi:hypothetical protein [Massilia sp. DD77]|uniref:hypothetical protein n=1 Tax=Massilia sp. DD77 TaxID=3109349 RepID=UPI002FFEA73B
MMKDSPRFPVTITFDDGDVWILDDVGQIGTNLEYFDSEDEDDSLTIVDAFWRPIRVLVRDLQVLIFELKVEAE